METPSVSTKHPYCVDFFFNEFFIYQLFFSGIVFRREPKKCRCVKYENKSKVKWFVEEMQFVRVDVVETIKLNSIPRNGDKTSIIRKLERMLCTRITLMLFKLYLQSGMCLKIASLQDAFMMSEFSLNFQSTTLYRLLLIKEANQRERNPRWHWVKRSNAILLRGNKTGYPIFVTSISVIYLVLP